MKLAASFLFSILLAASLVGCRSADSQGDQPSLAELHRHVLRTYQVPPGHQKTLKRLLGSSTYPISIVDEKGEQKTQFAHLRPMFSGKGFFVLSAPEGIHEGVEGLLSILNKVPPQRPGSIEMTYWMVLGYPAKETSVASAVEEIRKPLEALSQPMRFELLEKMRLLSIDGKEVRAQGKYSRVNHIGSLQRGKLDLTLELNVSPGGGRIETELTLEPDQFAVLGQAGVSLLMEDLLKNQGYPANSDPTIFYIIRGRTGSTAL